MLAATAASAQEVLFSGNMMDAYDAPVAANTGLNHLYVLNSAEGVAMSYIAADPNETVTWYSFDARGGAYAEEVTRVEQVEPGVTMLNPIKADCGYYVEEGTNRYYLWIADYSKCVMSLNALTFGEMGDCGTATLQLDGTGEDIVYYTINGVRRVLDRGLKLTYHSLEWNEEEERWADTEVTETIDNFKNTIVVPAPLCNTTFTLAGDDLLTFWNLPQQRAESDVYQTIAVDIKTFAIQEERNNDNEQKRPDGSSTLGGSAPVTITFKAYCTDAVVYKEWQMSTDSEFQNLELRLNTNEVEQTFDESGIYYWRFLAGNADGTCDAVSETYTVEIGESDLVCPNIFTPGTSEGANDVWKVSYKSIVEFHCSIFSRYGVKVAEFNDPNGGWDGRYGGKLVKAGVYFYVIQARGADGKNYKLSGDINIIRFKKNLAGGSGGSGEDPNPADPVDPTAE